MTTQTVKITSPLFSDDTRAMLDCLRTLGISTNTGQDFIEVNGDINDVADNDHELNADLSGTTMRFLLALSSVLPGRQTLRGQKRLEERPIGDLVDALRQLGADISYLGQEGYPPVLISSSKLTADTVKLGGGQSSQYLSALLMIAPLIGDLTIEITGELISKPFASMTIGIMREFGVEATNKDYRTYHIAAGQRYKRAEYAIEADASSASYLFAIAALTGSTLTVGNIEADSQQADMKFLGMLEALGADVSSDRHDVTVAGRNLRPVHVNMSDCPDQAQTLAVLAAFADGVTTIDGIKSLRIKETERVRALDQELAKMGIQTSSTPDSLTIHGGRPRAASVATYNDHRMAMAFAVAGTKLPGMSIQDPGVVSKTFPGFWQKLEEIGVVITPAERS